MKSSHQKNLKAIIKEKHYPYIGSQLKKRRNELGLTMIDASNIAGVSRIQVINYENGKQMTVPALLAFSEAYKRPVSYFLPEEFK